MENHSDEELQQHAQDSPHERSPSVSDKEDVESTANNTVEALSGSVQGDSSVASSLSQLERDIQSKTASSSTSASVRPGAVAVPSAVHSKLAGVGCSLQQLEKDIETKLSGRRSKTTPGAVAVSGAESLRQLEQDVTRKGRRQHSRIPSDKDRGYQTTAPGAHAVNCSASLSRLERDVLAKGGSRTSKGTSVPGAHSVTGSASLTTLERDVSAKGRSRPPKSQRSSVEMDRGAVPTSLGRRTGSDNVSTPGAHSVSGSASLTALERDVLAKDRSPNAQRSSVEMDRGAAPTSLGQRADSDHVSTPGAHAVSGSASLIALERDVLAKGGSQSPIGQRSSVDYAGVPGGAAGLGLLNELENDVLSKSRARVWISSTPGVVPGAQAISGSAALSKLQRDILEKGRSITPPLSKNYYSQGATSLTQLEQDVRSKDRAQVGVPGGTVGGGSLNELESDVFSKNVARVGRSVAQGAVPGAHTIRGSAALSALEREVLEKGSSKAPPPSRNFSSQGSTSLSQLERDAMSKTCARSDPGRESSLAQLEEDVAAKSRARGSGGVSLNRLEEDVVSKMQGRQQRSDHNSSGSYSAEALPVIQPTDGGIADNENHLSPATRIGVGSAAPGSSHGNRSHDGLSRDGLSHDGLSRTESYDDGYRGSSHASFDERSIGEDIEQPMVDSTVRPDDDYHDSFASRGENGPQATADDAASNGQVVLLADTVLTATSAIVVIEAEEHAMEGKRMKKYILIGMLSVIAFVVGIVSVAIVVSGQSDDPVVVASTPAPTIAPSPQPSAAPSFSPTTEDFVDLLEALRPYYPDGDYFEEVFSDFSSPQYSAAQWIANEDLYPHNSFADPKTIQRYALATFYFATNGDDWIKCGRLDKICEGDPDETSWLAGDDECRWNAIRCNSGTTVDVIFFNSAATGPTRSAYQLSGTLPHELVLLTDLATVIMERNEIEGSIPSTWSTMKNLKTLRVSENLLTGSLPEVLFTETSLLGTIHLFDNRLSGDFPTTLLSPQLKSLRLNGNDIGGTISSGIGYVPSLRIFDVEGNKLEGDLPKEVFQLTNLERLRVGGNSELYGQIDAQVGNLVSLQELSCGGLMNGTLPAGLFNLTELVSLELSNARFSGTVPEMFLQLTNLELVLLNNNTFTGNIPTAFDSLEKLTTLRLHGNALTGPVSQTLCGRVGKEVKEIGALSTDCKKVNGDALVTCSCCTACYSPA